MKCINLQKLDHQDTLGPINLDFYSAAIKITASLKNIWSIEKSSIC